jgi:hypothetical protein
MTTTAATTGTRALLVPMMDFSAEVEDETNLWFDYDHVPDRLSCEGITAAQRFQRSPIEPIGWSPSQRWTTYLHFYSLSSPDVLDSPAYDLQRTMNDGRGSDWRQLREARQKAEGRPSPVRSLRTSWIEREVPWGGRRPVEVPEPRVILVHLRHDLGELDDAVNDFVDHHLVREMLMLPGVLGCERYEAVATQSTSAAASTATFRHPRYMDIFDLTTPEVVVSGVFRQYMRSLESFSPEVLEAWRPVGSGVYVQRPSPWRTSVNL